MTAANDPATGPRLATPEFVILAAATLAFFIAGGLVLPIAPRFAKLALDADALGFGLSIGSFSIASLVLRPVVGWSAALRCGGGRDHAGRCEVVPAPGRRGGRVGSWP